MSSVCPQPPARCKTSPPSRLLRGHRSRLLGGTVVRAATVSPAWPHRTHGTGTLRGGYAAPVAPCAPGCSTNQVISQSRAESTGTFPTDKGTSRIKQSPFGLSLLCLLEELAQLCSCQLPLLPHGIQEGWVSSCPLCLGRPTHWVWLGWSSRREGNSSTLQENPVHAQTPVLRCHHHCLFGCVPYSSRTCGSVPWQAAARCFAGRCSAGLALASVCRQRWQVPEPWLLSRHSRSGWAGAGAGGTGEQRCCETLGRVAAAPSPPLGMCGGHTPLCR